MVIRRGRRTIDISVTSFLGSTHDVSLVFCDSVLPHPHEKSKRGVQTSSLRYGIYVSELHCSCAEKQRAVLLIDGDVIELTNTNDPAV